MDNTENEKYRALEKLQSLKDSNALTEEEFEAAKRRILDDDKVITGGFESSGMINEIAADTEAFEGDEFEANRTNKSFWLGALPVLVLALAGGTAALMVVENEPQNKQNREHGNEQIHEEESSIPNVKLDISKEFVSDFEVPLYAVKNIGEIPVIVESAFINGRDECEVSAAYFKDAPMRVLNTGENRSRAMLFNKASLEALTDRSQPQDPFLQLLFGGGFEQREFVELKVGQSVTVGNSVSCGDIVNIDLVTDEGIFSYNLAD